MYPSPQLADLSETEIRANCHQRLPFSPTRPGFSASLSVRSDIYGSRILLYIGRAQRKKRMRVNLPECLQTGRTRGVINESKALPVDEEPLREVDPVLELNDAASSNADSLAIQFNGGLLLHSEFPTTTRS